MSKRLPVVSIVGQTEDGRFVVEATSGSAGRALAADGYEFGLWWCVTSEGKRTQRQGWVRPEHADAA